MHHSESVFFSLAFFFLVADDALLFLLFAREKSGNVHQSDHRNVESVTEADKTRRLIRSVDVQAAGEKHRLIGDKTGGATVETAKTDHQVARELRLDLEEFAVVDDRFDDLENSVTPETSE